jgi:hypothetical protein
MDIANPKIKHLFVTGVLQSGQRYDTRSKAAKPNRGFKKET